MVSPVVLVLQAVGLVGLALLSAVILLSHRDVPVPAAIAERLEASAETALETDLEFGPVTLIARGGGRLGLSAEDVRLIGPEGDVRARLPRIEADLQLRSFLPPFSAPRFLRLEGADLRIVRRADGTLDLGSEVLGAIFSRAPPKRPSEVAARVRGMLTRPVMTTLDTLEVDDLSLTFQDLGSDRIWRVDDAQLRVSRGENTIEVGLGLAQPGEIAFRALIPAEGPLDLQLSASLKDVPAADLAAEIPALVWLAPLKAEASGALIGSYSAEDVPGRLDGTLDVGPGVFAPDESAPLPFDRAQTYFSYRPEDRRITFSQIEIDLPNGRIAAEGHADLDSNPEGVTTSMTAQIVVREGRIDTGPESPAPLSLTGGAVDARIQFSPFVLDIGQIVLEAPAEVAVREAPGTPLVDVAVGTEGPAEEIRLFGQGRVVARDGRVHSRFDLSLPAISPRRLLSFWPFGAAPGTRTWLANNLRDARLEKTQVGVRLVTGDRPDISFSFLFRDARVRLLRGLPPVVGGAGRATLGDDRFSLSVEAGHIAPPLGGELDVSGSVFTIPDTRLRPADGQVRWRSDSSLTAALSLLDQPPLRLIERTGRSINLAEGQARLLGELRFPIRKGVTPDQVGFDFAGVLTDVSSETLVPERLLTSQELLVSTDPTGLEIAGRAVLDEVPLTAAYRQDFGPEAAAPVVSGEANVTKEALSSLGVDLPDGMISGAGRADVTLRFPQESSPELTVTSDLRGMDLALPQLGWTKPADEAVELNLTVTLGAAGQPPSVDRLSLESSGLDAEGRLTLTAEGGIDRLDLSALRAGRWFDGPVSLRGRGAGRAPDIALNGGRLDVRGAPFGEGDGAGQGGGRLSGRLDRLILSEGVTLSDVALQLDRSGGTSGTVSGRINGGASVSGELSAGRNGRPAIRIRADDAGGVLAAAGAFEEAVGGTLEATLAPGRQDGLWEGSLKVDDIRVTAAPGLAALLNAISVVGLLDQLNGSGLAFSTIQASFRLTPRGVEIRSASAVGPSLGVSAEGTYDQTAGRVNLQGVLSPIYFVNSIGQVFTREGEGLFGMNYSISGAASAPEIRVNPLSILTPGAFREIFREAPPEPDAGGRP